MQTLWNRAVQARYSCKCTSCLSTTSVIARRASIAATRQLLKPSPSSTFLYSTIFAAAVVADARSKQKRRAQWDAAIATAKEDLGETVDKEELPASSDKTETEGQHVHARMARAEAYWKDLEHVGAIDDAVGMRIFQDWADEIEDLDDSQWQNLDFLSHDTWRPKSQRPHLPVSTNEKINRRFLPPQSIWSTGTRRRKAMQANWWTMKKLRMSEAQTARFILACLRNTKLHNIPAEQLDNFPETLRSLISLTDDEIRNAYRETHRYITLLQRSSPELDEGLPKPPAFFPRYKEDSRNEYYVVCDRMNKAILRSFRKYEAKEMSFESLIAVVCHNLLVSSASPDVRTYNILISAFSRLKKPELVENAIVNVLWIPIRPNEITCASILNHYTQTNNPTKFSEFVARMRGTHEEAGTLRGLMDARPNLEIKEDNQSRLVRVSDDRIIQKVHPTSMVFNAIIKGLIKFAGFRRALEIYADLQLDGWGLDSRGLSVLLYDCLDRRDWESGVLVWDQIQRLKARGRRRLEKKTYDIMLALCQLCERRETFKSVFVEALEAGYMSEMLIKGSFKFVTSTTQPTSGLLSYMEHTRGARRSRELSNVSDSTTQLEVIGAHRPDTAATESHIPPDPSASTAEAEVSREIQEAPEPRKPGKIMCRAGQRISGIPYISSEMVDPVRSTRHEELASVM